MARTAATVAEFARRALRLGANDVRIVATSAVREAANGPEFAALVRSVAGRELHVITGEEEARLTLLGVSDGLPALGGSFLLFDVGGGSTEFIVGQAEQKHFRRSFPLGSVRLLEKFPPSDPPKAEELSACRKWLKEFLRQEVRPKLEPALRREIERATGNDALRLVATGGAASILARVEGELETFDRERIEATRLTLARLRHHVERLWRLPLEERKKVIGLPPNRADVILFGAAIYEVIMEEFEFGELRISTRGIRFAAVMQAA
jgi:exopolyphosphatase/guanosine-5'-triphosphate,3'-diphosphate pyrophosphatase